MHIYRFGVPATVSSYVSNYKGCDDYSTAIKFFV